MLLSLSIRDFVIVEQLDLEFASGFTVLTGETGAGKSILIDALQFVLGERTQSDAVREGAVRAEVAAEFRCSPAAAEWLAQSGFDVANEGDHDAGTESSAQVLVRRTLEAGGRSRCFLNGSPATLGQLRELGQFLLDVHGQHEHQSLLRAAAQQQLLDTHGGLQEPARAVAGAYAAWRGAARMVAEAQAAQAQSTAQAEQLRLLVDDLDALAPETGEWERVESEQRRLANGAALLEGTRQALDDVAESENALESRVARVQARLSALQTFDPRLTGIVEALGNAQIQLEEAGRELNQYVARSESDGGLLAQVDERISALHAAGRKWRCPPGGLAALLETSRTALARLAQGQDLDALHSAEARAAQEYRAQAEALSVARRKAALSMGREVTRAMQDLAMTGGRFEVRLAPAEAAATGLERAEFLVSAHEAGTARPLAKVASGGELSRVGLAISVIAASANPVPTLIFDEVDSGIGGQVAATVGRLLRELGQSRQVFCVTHLPQVASCGDQHLTVRKSTLAGGQPVSHTEALSGNARVQEIARMLGGSEITALTQRHAREMLTRP
jgi:DNA repair protein RecN (Recombination protein N)